MPPPLLNPTNLLRRLFFSLESGHIIKRPSPPLSSLRPSKWHDDPLKVTAVLGLVAGGAYVGVRLRYGEMEPFTGRTHVSVLSHKEARELDEARFAMFKKEHAADILSPSHEDTVRVRRIALAMVRAAHHGLAIRQHHIVKAQHLAHGGLNWMDGLDWEVIVIRGPSTHAAECVFPAQVGHVIARHSSGIYDWLHTILEDKPMLILLVMPFLLPFLLPLKRRGELEADQIGILLIAAAGIDPIIAIKVRQRAAMMSGEVPKLLECLSYFSLRPSSKKRWQFLSQPNILGEALELYNQVINQAQG